MGKRVAALRQAFSWSILSFFAAHPPPPCLGILQIKLQNWFGSTSYASPAQETWHSLWDMGSIVLFSGFKTSAKVREKKVPTLTTDYTVMVLPWCQMDLFLSQVEQKGETLYNQSLLLTYESSCFWKSSRTYYFRLYHYRCHRKLRVPNGI